MTRDIAGPWVKCGSIGPGDRRCDREAGHDGFHFTDGEPWGLYKTDAIHKTERMAGPRRVPCPFCEATGAGTVGLAEHLAGCKSAPQVAFDAVWAQGYHSGLRRSEEASMDNVTERMGLTEDLAAAQSTTDYDYEALREASRLSAQRRHEVLEGVELLDGEFRRRANELGEMTISGLLAPCHLLPLLEIWAMVDWKDCKHLDWHGVDSLVVRELMSWGLIEYDDRKDLMGAVQHPCRVTDKGRAYIEALLATPLPVQQWVMP